MGNKCINGCHKPQIKKKPEHSILPSDIDNYKPQNLQYSLPKIMFDGQIFNIQLINCPQGSFSLNFQITDVISIMLPEKQVEKDHKNKSQTFGKQLQWKLHEKFGFVMTQYELRSRFLIIQIFGAKKQKLNQIEINLYKIASGPQHHDLQIVLGKQKYSRLKFDFKISQILEVNLNINKIKIQFDDDLEGQQFDYSFKIIRNNEVVEYSESSDPKFVRSPQEKNLYRESTLDDQCKSPLKFRKSLSSNKLIKRDLKSYVQWGQPDRNPNSLLNITGKLFSNDINSSFFYFLVWKNPKQQSSQKINKQDWNLYAGALINFKKIFQAQKQQKTMLIDPDLQTSTSSIHNEKIKLIMQQRKIFIQQPLWGEDGNSFIGKCYIELQMKNSKFFKQLQACALTEDGIVNMTFLFKNYAGKNYRNQNRKESKIIEMYQQNEDIFKKLTNIPRDSYSNRSEVLLLQEQVYQNFHRIAQTIKNTMNQSFVIFSNSNAQQIKQVTQRQMLLIQLLDRIYYLIDDNTNYATICWEIILLIMRRGQFLLQNIGFIAFDKSNNDLYQIKRNTAIRYESVLFKYFLMSLRIENTSIRNSMNSNIQAFKAYSYIRIPKFRQKLIDSIQKAYDQDIIDLKLEQLDTVTSEISSLLKNNKNHPIINLNWDKYFYDQIAGNEENAALERQVLDEIQNSQWIEEISKRQDTFFGFTAQLVKRLNQLTLRQKTWKWNYFPGYTKIVRGFMVQMKKRKLSQYPPLMIKTSSQLLANEQLVNILMPIIIQKTNSFNKAQVIKCISILQSFFNYLTQKQTKQLPRSFNYLYFFKSYKLIIETIENTEAIVKALILVYDFYEWFSPEWRDNFTMYLLGKVFFKLFFHWSFQVRIIFYNFLIIKIKYTRIQQMPKLPSNSQSVQMNAKIQQRYDQITTILTNAQSLRRLDGVDYRTLFEKEAYKKMRNKLKVKKQKKQKKSSQYSQECHSLKQNQTQKGKYSLQNLLVSKNNIKKKSQDQTRNRSFTQFNFQKIGQDNNSTMNQQALHITRGNSFFLDTQSYQNGRKFSTDMSLQNAYKKKSPQNQENEQNSLDQMLESKTIKNKKQRKGSVRVGRLALDLKGINTKLNYNIYNKQDHQLTEISPSQINYILKGVEQYRETLQQINKYYQKKGELPKRQLEIEPFISDQV